MADQRPEFFDERKPMEDPRDSAEIAIILAKLAAIDNGQPPASGPRAWHGDPIGYEDNLRRRLSELAGE